MKNYYLGIDVSKGYADFVILDTNKMPIENNFQLDDTFQGHTCLYEKLSRFMKARPGARIYAGLESTGGFENNWFNTLLKFQGVLNIQTARINPMGVNANAKARLNRNTTDKISAQNVAEYMIAHPEKIEYQVQDPLYTLRRQWNYVQMLTKQNVQLLNELESLLYIANPELLAYCKHGVNDWTLKLLLAYPTAAELANASIKDVKAIPYISVPRALALIQNAKHSVASATDTAAGQLIVSVVAQIMNLKKVIQSQVQTMSSQCNVDEMELLKSFTGISDYSAIGLLVHIQSVERFSSAKKLASFFGLHPVYKQSGDSKGGMRMSKQGNSTVRHILFMITLNAIRCNPLIKKIYSERTAKGMSKMSAIGLCMHKILRIIYGMLKNKTRFDSEIDRQNRLKSAQRPKSGTKQDKTRRYQAYDEKAPISKRAHKKRKELVASQSAVDATNGINCPAPVTTTSSLARR